MSVTRKSNSIRIAKWFFRSRTDVLIRTGKKSNQSISPLITFIVISTFSTSSILFLCFSWSSISHRLSARREGFTAFSTSTHLAFLTTPTQPSNPFSLSSQRRDPPFYLVFSFLIYNPLFSFMLLYLFSLYFAQLATISLLPSLPRIEPTHCPPPRDLQPAPHLASTIRSKRVLYYFIFPQPFDSHNYISCCVLLYIIDINFSFNFVFTFIGLDINCILSHITCAIIPGRTFTD